MLNSGAVAVPPKDLLSLGPRVPHGHFKAILCMMHQLKPDTLVVLRQRGIQVTLEANFACKLYEMIKLCSDKPEVPSSAYADRIHANSSSNL